MFVNLLLLSAFLTASFSLPGNLDKSVSAYQSTRTTRQPAITVDFAQACAKYSKTSIPCGSDFLESMIHDGDYASFAMARAAKNYSSDVSFAKLLVESSMRFPDISDVRNQHDKNLRDWIESIFYNAFRDLKTKCDVAASFSMGSINMLTGRFIVGRNGDISVLVIRDGVLFQHLEPEFKWFGEPEYLKTNRDLFYDSETELNADYLFKMFVGDRRRVVYIKTTLRPGDIVIVGSYGLAANLYPTEIATLVTELYKSLTDQGYRGYALVEKLGTVLTFNAYYNSLSNRTKYANESRIWPGQRPYRQSADNFVKRCFDTREGCSWNQIKAAENLTEDGYQFNNLDGYRDDISIVVGVVSEPRPLEYMRKKTTLISFAPKA